MVIIFCFAVKKGKYPPDYWCGSISKYMRQVRGVRKGIDFVPTSPVK